MKSRRRRVMLAAQRRGRRPGRTVRSVSAPQVQRPDRRWGGVVLWSAVGVLIVAAAIVGGALPESQPPLPAKAEAPAHELDGAAHPEAQSPSVHAPSTAPSDGPVLSVQSPAFRPQPDVQWLVTLAASVDLDEAALQRHVGVIDDVWAVLSAQERVAATTAIEQALRLRRDRVVWSGALINAMSAPMRSAVSTRFQEAWPRQGWPPVFGDVAISP